ncbi:hypothetical protein [Streptomyces sp. NPDC001194]|uniref:hypothetical protein n=1 Tax=Streptomyces sp. NPDC001194 TaxID=3364547 RepID=UPI0036BCA7E2
MNGSPRVYSGGQLVDEKDPVLRTHGHLFEDADTHVAARTARAAEMATAVPGEARTLGAPPPPLRYDPGADNVKDVLARLAGVADLDERRRILDAEAEGQARAGILKHRGDLLGEVDPE